MMIRLEASTKCCSVLTKFFSQVSKLSFSPSILTSEVSHAETHEPAICCGDYRQSQCWGGCRCWSSGPAYVRQPGVLCKRKTRSTSRSELLCHCRAALQPSQPVKVGEILSLIIERLRWFNHSTVAFEGKHLNHRGVYKQSGLTISSNKSTRSDCKAITILAVQHKICFEWSWNERELDHEITVNAALLTF